MQHEVFISYHRNSSAELVEHIVAALESHGIKCWYAPRDVDSSYAGDIVKAINTCKVFLLVINEQSSHSAHVLNEIDCAFNRFHQHESIRLLPFRTDNREISDDVRYYLGRIHFLDGTEPPEEDRINALVSRISYWIQSSEWNNNAQPVVQVQSIHSTTLVHNTNFVGRASELNEIYRLLHSDNNKLFLCGTGGIGKSELARQYGLKFQNEYRTILWFTYKSIAIMKQLLTLNPEPLKASWYHYYISNQLRCLEQYDGLSSEAALSLSLLKDLPDSLEKKQQLSRSYSMMGWAKYHTDDFEQAFSYFEHSLHLRKETLSDDNVLIAWAYFNSASVLTKMKETEKAIQYYEEAIRRFLLINEIGICVPAYICIAEAYLDLNDCTKATNALEQAFTYEYEYYGEENCRKYWLYDIKSKILEKQGKNDEAAEYRRWSEEEYKKYIQSRET